MSELGSVPRETVDRLREPAAWLIAGWTGFRVLTALGQAFSAGGLIDHGSGYLAGLAGPLAALPAFCALLLLAAAPRRSRPLVTVLVGELAAAAVLGAIGLLLQLFAWESFWALTAFLSGAAGVGLIALGLLAVRPLVTRDGSTAKPYAPPSGFAEQGFGQQGPGQSGQRGSGQQARHAAEAPAEQAAPPGSPAVAQPSAQPVSQPPAQPASSAPVPPVSPVSAPLVSSDAWPVSPFEAQSPPQAAPVSQPTPLGQVHPLDQPHRTGSAPAPVSGAGSGFGSGQVHPLDQAYPLGQVRPLQQEPVPPTAAYPAHQPAEARPEGGYAAPPQEYTPAPYVPADAQPSGTFPTLDRPAYTPSHAQQSPDYLSVPGEYGAAPPAPVEAQPELTYPQPPQRRQQPYFTQPPAFEPARPAFEPVSDSAFADSAGHPGREPAGHFSQDSAPQQSAETPVDPRAQQLMDAYQQASSYQQSTSPQPSRIPDYQSQPTATPYDDPLGRPRTRDGDDASQDYLRQAETYQGDALGVRGDDPIDPTAIYTPDPRK